MGGSSKSATVGYKYYMGVHLALCHGPVDEISELVIGERSAWTGSVKESGKFSVNKPDLFGGEAREGGVAGVVDVMMGERTQGINDYLSKKISDPLPAFRGLTTCVFRGQTMMINKWTGEVYDQIESTNGFYWSAISPYFKAPWLRVRRVKKGWSRDTPWYPEKAEIGRDMNPAHIVYECLTNLEWGMGYPPTALNDASFRACADKLHSESFGLSMLWMEQSTINDFVQTVLNHVDGVLKSDIRTGLFEFNLIRNDYDINTIPELNKSNIIALDSYQRMGWGDTSNEIVVKYTDREQKEATVAVHDLASIEAQGGLISSTRDYPGIREDTLARRVAMRDLNNVSTPLAKVIVRTNRIAWDWAISDVFSLVWSKLGIEKVAFRVIKINKGELTNGEITIEAIEDIFGLPSSTYVSGQPAGWTDPINAPQPVTAARAIEAPWWDVVQMLPASEIDYLPDGWAFAEILAVRPTSDAYDFNLNASSDNSNYATVGMGSFGATGTLAVAMPKGESEITFTLSNAFDIENVGVKDYFYIDNEAFAINSLNPVTGQVIARRGVLDTIPAAHAQGARVYFVEIGQGYDPTTRLEGETTYYKPLTRTGRGTLDVASAVPISMTFTGRAMRPYPPGRFRVAGSISPTTGEFAPSEIEGNVVLSWAHRDRIQQTVSLIDSTSGNIGPETGTTYTARLLRADTNAVLVTQTGVTAATVTLNSDYEGQVIVELWSVRDGLDSWQCWTHLFFKYAGPISAPTGLTGTYQE